MVYTKALRFLHYGVPSEMPKIIQELSVELHRFM